MSEELLQRAVFYLIHTVLIQYWILDERSGDGECDTERRPDRGRRTTAVFTPYCYYSATNRTLTSNRYTDSEAEVNA